MNVISTIRLTGVFTISIMLISQCLIAQKMQYSKFTGKVYKLPNARKYKKFDEDYQDIYPLLNEISWDSIYVEQRDVEKGFPDVSRNGAFGIMFTSVLSIEETSMYRFAVTSDDGSIIWIDDKLIVENDYSKGFHMKADTIALYPGEYKVNIWYSQIYPTMFGIIFESNAVDAEVVFEKDTISLDQDLLFDLNSSKVKHQGIAMLKDVNLQLANFRQANIYIKGHTDNIGKPEYNLKLSQARADAIKDYFLANLPHHQIVIYARGLGDAEPIATNDTEEGRSRNRRVELIVEGQ